MTLVNIDNTTAIFGSVEAIQFYASGNRNNGYFDGASANDIEDMSERIRSYLTRNAEHDMPVGKVRSIAEFIGNAITLPTNSPEANSLYALMQDVNAYFAGMDIVIHFVTSKGEYLSIKPNN
jgi:hypothetical protein